MASKRDLKKDINYLVDEVIGTCMMHQEFNSKDKDSKSEEMIREMLEFREEMITKVNNPETKDNSGKELRKYYRTLQADLISKVNEMFERLDSIKE